jgi:hypothetical protein
LPETEYFVVWDKKQTVKNYASAEIAWTNIKQPALVFRLDKDYWEAQEERYKQFRKDYALIDEALGIEIETEREGLLV